MIELNVLLFWRETFVESEPLFTMFVVVDVFSQLFEHQDALLLNNDNKICCWLFVQPSWLVVCGEPCMKYWESRNQDVNFYSQDLIEHRHDQNKVFSLTSCSRISTQNFKTVSVDLAQWDLSIRACRRAARIFPHKAENLFAVTAGCSLGPFITNVSQRKTNRAYTVRSPQRQALSCP